MAENHPENASRRDHWGDLAEELGLPPEQNTALAPAVAEESLDARPASPVQPPHGPNAYRKSAEKVEPSFGVVTGVNDDGCCFIDHWNALEGVFLPPKYMRQQLAKGDLVVFEVNDWSKKPRPTALRPKKIQLDDRKLLYGTVVEWDRRESRGKILPERGTELDMVSFSDKEAHPAVTERAHWRQKPVRFHKGEIVSFWPINAEHPIFVRPDRSFRRFAVLEQEENMLQSLSGKALEEKWDYPGSRPFHILWSYLFHTFERLEEEDKKLADNEKKIRIAGGDQGRIAVFDTGLVDHLYKVLFAVFEEIRGALPGQPCWRLVGFCTEGERLHGRFYLTAVRLLPGRAKYWDNPADRVFDDDLRVERNTRHIVEERGHRLPVAIRERIPKDMKDEDQVIAFLDKELAKAIEWALQRIKWRWQTAIPQYYAKAKRMQLLLPLCLQDPGKVDLALAVQREGQAYVGHTILELDWAYSNARLISRPDSDWLAVDKLKEGEDSETDARREEPETA